MFDIIKKEVGSMLIIAIHPPSCLIRNWPNSKSAELSCHFIYVEINPKKATIGSMSR